MKRTAPTPMHLTASARAIAQMQVVADALPDPAILLNATGHVLFCNRSGKGPVRGLARRQPHRLGDPHA